MVHVPSKCTGGYGKNDEARIAERKKAKMEDPAPEAMGKINKAEVPGSGKVECLKIRPIAPEDMMKFYSEKDPGAPETICKYLKAKGREAECITFIAIAPEAMGKYDKGGCLESEKANGCKILPSTPEAIPKVGSAKGPKRNASKLHTSHPSVLEAMLRIDGASSTVA
jgi:hypothetical protein